MEAISKYHIKHRMINELKNAALRKRKKDKKSDTKILHKLIF